MSDTEKHYCEPFEQYVSASEVAVYLKIERREVLELTRAGKLPGHPLDPDAERKTWRYKLNEIDAAISGNRKPIGVALVQDGRSLDNGDGSPRSRKGTVDGTGK